MKVINFWGGPGSGKSTTAAYVFAKLKNAGMKTELSREVAKDFIWEGRDVQLTRNQILLLALQYARLKDLADSGCDIAVSDSPLLLSNVYAKASPYYLELRLLALRLNAEFENIDVYVNRAKPYSQFGRVQDEQDARLLDHEMRQELLSHSSKCLTATGDAAGQEAIANTLIWQL